MITIKELRKAANKFDQATDSNNLITLVNKIVKDADEKREITTDELVQFYNSGIASKLHTPFTSNEYKPACRLINALCNKPSLKDNSDLLEIMNQLAYSPKMSDELITQIFAHTEPLSFAMACRMLNVDSIQNDMLLALVNSKSNDLIASAEVYNEALKSGLINSQEQSISILMHGKPRELIDGLNNLNEINYRKQIDLTNLKNCLCKNAHPLQLSDAFIKIYQANIHLSEAQQDSLSTFNDPEIMSEYIIQSPTLSNVYDHSKIIDDVLSHTSAKEFIEALELIESKKLSLINNDAMYDILRKDFSPLALAKDYIATHENLVMQTSHDQTHQPLSDQKRPEKLTKQKKSPLLPDAYNQRDVLSLYELSTWTENVKKINLEHNRILQPGFLIRDAADFLADAKLTGEQWLDDLSCPSVNSALLLHIAKEMVVNYKVKEDELNIAAHSVYHSVFNDDKNISVILEEKIQTKLNNLMDQHDWQANLQQMAEALLTKNKIHDYTTEQMEAAKRLVIDGKRKAITNEMVADYIKLYLKQNAANLNLFEKPVYAMGESNDYSFLGAAGSGKSTISRLYIHEDKKSDYITLSLDNYRCFTLPGTDAHEEKDTKDVFTRTQDMAYLVKALVQNEIDSKVENENGRPNIVCDCVTLDDQLRKFVSQGNVVSVVAAYRGEPGYVGIAERADLRARDPDAAPADLKRFVETTALFKGHALASQYILSSIPQHGVTTIFDTAVERGEKPVEIAKINVDTHVIEISNLRVTSEFLNKRNMNINAINQVDLILNKNDLNLLATHPENKAKSILSLMSASKNPYTIQLKSDDIVYAELKTINGKINLEILDENIFKNKSKANTSEASVLNAIERQVKLGDIKASFEAAQNNESKIYANDQTFFAKPKKNKVELKEVKNDFDNKFNK